MTIQCDSRERKNEHIKEYFDRNGIKWFVSKMVVADYMDMDRPRFCIDRKQNLEELCGNVCQDHARFKAELTRAQDIGITLIFLCEHGDGIKELSDVRHWRNPRCAISPYAMEGWELYRRLVTIENKYSTRFYFCTKEQTGSQIIKLLGGN